MAPIQSPGNVSHKKKAEVRGGKLSGTSPTLSSRGSNRQEVSLPASAALALDRLGTDRMGRAIPKASSNRKPGKTKKTTINVSVTALLKTLLSDLKRFRARYGALIEKISEEQGTDPSSVAIAYQELYEDWLNGTTIRHGPRSELQFLFRETLRPAHSLIGRAEEVLLARSVTSEQNLAINLAFTNLPFVKSFEECISTSPSRALQGLDAVQIILMKAAKGQVVPTKTLKQTEIANAKNSPANALPDRTAFVSNIVTILDRAKGDQPNKQLLKRLRISESLLYAIRRGDQSRYGLKAAKKIALILECKPEELYDPSFTPVPPVHRLPTRPPKTLAQSESSRTP